MGLRQALLGILTANDFTGYEFSKEFQESVALIWSAPASQIYPELRRMEESQLITGEEEARGSSGRSSSIKRRYTITEAGEQAFDEWLHESLPFAAERNARRLQSAYYDRVSHETARQHFEEHIDHWQRRLALWQKRHDAIVERKYPLMLRLLEARDPAEHDEICAFKAHAYSGQVAIAKAEIEWAQQGLAIIEAFEQRRAATDPVGAG